MQIFRPIFILCFSVFSLQCTFGPSSWSPILERLNRDDVYQPDTILKADVDLDTVREVELATVSAKCQGKSLTDRNVCFASQIQALNDRALRAVLAHDVQHSPISALAQRIIDEIEGDPVTSSSTAYDLENGNQIGFCFGRALVAHHQLLRAGIAQRDILKVFAVGELMVNTQVWHFHVAVIVRDGTGAWFVVDPLIGTTVSVREWIRRVQAYDIKHPYPRTRFYVTDPRKFLPSSGMYSESDFAHSALRDYFHRIVKRLIEEYRH